MNGIVSRLLNDFGRISEAPDAVPRMRRFVLDLAVRGKLVPQDPDDEPASELLKRIAAEKARLVKKGAIRKQKAIPAVDTDEVAFSTPVGWAWARLSTICWKIHYGYTASANKLINDIRLLRITDIQENAVNWTSVPGCEIDEKMIAQYELQSGDILIARTGGTIGKSFLVQEIPVKAVFASYLIRVQGSPELFDRYLKLFLESPVYWRQLEDGSRGAGQPNVNGQALGRMYVPLPPLDEQHRIVAKVDELMTLCDRLEAAREKREATRDRLAAASLARLNRPDPDPQTFRDHASFALESLAPLTTRSDQIKALRQTILNLAVRGKLAPQDPDDEPASELLKRIAAEKARLVKAKMIKKQETQPVRSDEPTYMLPSYWVWTRLGAIGDWGSGSTPRRGGEGLFGGGITWLKSGELNDIRQLTGSEETVTELAITKGSFRANQPGDVLIAMYGATIGKVGILAERAVTNQAVCGCTPFEGVFNQFLFLFLLAQREQFQVASEGGAQPNISKVKIVGTLFPLPPLSEQQRVVAKVDELMALCDRLEASLSAAASTRRRLLEAILHAALTPARDEAKAA